MIFVIRENCLGTPGKYVEPQGSQIFEGMGTVEQFQMFGSGQKLIFPAELRSEIQQKPQSMIYSAGRGRKGVC